MAKWRERRSPFLSTAFGHKPVFRIRLTSFSRANNMGGVQYLITSISCPIISYRFFKFFFCSFQSFYLLLRVDLKSIIWLSFIFRDLPSFVSGRRLTFVISERRFSKWFINPFFEIGADFESFELWSLFADLISAKNRLIWNRSQTVQ